MIDIEYAQNVGRYILGKLNDLNKLDIPDFHKYVIKKRLDRLLSLKEHK